jgi:predicted CXXCH cytochrome family protein
MALLLGGFLHAQAVSTVDKCLACHGPFGKLVATTSDYVWKSGEVQSPHRFVPHDSKAIAECTYCHKPHPVPPSASDIAAMRNPDPAYCYECHHVKNFTCGTCHPIE